MNTQANKLLNVLIKFEDILGSKLIGFISYMTFIIMIISMLFQVFCRFIIKLSVPWSEELIRYLFIFGTYLTTSLAAAEKSLIEINILDGLLEKCSPKYRYILAKIDDVLRISLSLAFSIVISVLCYKFLIQSKRIGQLTPTLSIPRHWLDMVIFVSWALVALFNFTLLLKILLSGKNDVQGGAA
jgi:TRAP-type C4-dicarboxylate transport system permease small subunit